MYDPNFTQNGIPPWMVTTPQGRPYPQNEQGQPMPPQNQGMPQPKSDISPMPQQPQAPVTPDAAAGTIGETPNQAKRQPGNRKSIRDYLEDIKQLQEYQRAMGVPEDQVAVPTFTNIQGGPMDVVQGQLPTGQEDFDAGTGGQPTGMRDVRSYMWGEYQQDPNAPMAPPSYGPEHTITRANKMMQGQDQETAGMSASVSNVLDPNFVNKTAQKMLPDLHNALRERLQREPSPEELMNAANGMRSMIMKEQMDQIDELQKTFKDAGAPELWEYLQTGDVSKVMTSANKLNTPESRQKRQARYVQEWQDIQQKSSTNIEPYPENPETGMPYQSGQEFVDQQMREFDELMGNLVNTAQAQSQTRYAGSPNQAPSAGGDRAEMAKQYFNALRQQNVSPDAAKAEVLKMFPEFAKGK